MRHFKSIISLVLTLVLVMGMGVTVFAETATIEQNEASVMFAVNDDGSITVLGNNSVDMEFEDSNDEILPYTTIGGTAGSATIRWVNKGQIYWRLNPATAELCIFAGTITIKNVSTNKTTKTLWVSGAGTGMISNNEYFSGLTKGQTYIATLSGGGTLGTKAWKVGKNCHEVFYIY